MARPEEMPALRRKVVELLETALKITEEIVDETSGLAEFTPRVLKNAALLKAGYGIGLRAGRGSPQGSRGPRAAPAPRVDGLGAQPRSRQRTGEPRHPARDADYGRLARAARAGEQRCEAGEGDGKGR